MAKKKKKELLLLATPGRVLLELDRIPDMTEAGIALPASVRTESPNMGTVIHVGPPRPIPDSTGSRFEPIPCSAGDTVIFSEFGVNTLGGPVEGLAVIDFKDILALVDD